MTTDEGSAGESPWPEDLSTEEMRDRLAGLSMDGLVARWSAGDDYDDYYEAVARELYARGDAGIEMLTRELDGRRVPQIRAALTILEMHQGNDPGLVEKVKRMVGDSEPLIAGDAIRLLGSLGVTELGELIRGKRDHPAPFVRAAVLDYLTRAEPEWAYPALVRGLRDSDYIVRETAVDALDDLDSAEAISAIEPLLEDPHEDVRLAARTAVDNLRGRANSAG